MQGQELLSSKISSKIGRITSADCTEAEGIAAVQCGHCTDCMPMHIDKIGAHAQQRTFIRGCLIVTQIKLAIIIWIRLVEDAICAIVCSNAPRIVKLSALLKCLSADAGLPLAGVGSHKRDHSGKVVWLVKSCALCCLHDKRLSELQT